VRERERRERRPARRAGARKQAQPACSGCAPASAIAFETARPTFSQLLRRVRARNHVIEIQLRARRTLAAVLTGEAIACHHVGAAEAHVATRDTVEDDQHDHARRRKTAAAGSDPLATVAVDDALVLMAVLPPVVSIQHSETAPLLEVEGAVFAVDHARDSLVDQRKSPPHRCHVDRQVRTIENQDRRVQHRELASRHGTRSPAGINAIHLAARS
jgi:hypothetical protein